MLSLLLTFVFLYLFVVFFISRFLIPHLWFFDSSVPNNIPLEFKKEIELIKQNAPNKKIFLELAYKYIGNRYHTGRLITLIKFNYLFKDIGWMASRTGFVPCTLTNYLLKIFLVKSGFFKEGDIRRRHTILNFLIHQYLEVKIENTWLSVDVGEKQRGIKLGEHANYF